MAGTDKFVTGVLATGKRYHDCNLLHTYFMNTSIAIPNTSVDKQPSGLTQYPHY